MSLHISEEVLRVIFFGVFGFDAVFLLASLLLVPLYFRYNDQGRWRDKTFVFWLLCCVGVVVWLLIQFDQPPLESESVLITRWHSVDHSFCPNPIYPAFIITIWFSTTLFPLLQAYFDLVRSSKSKPLLLLLCMIPGITIGIMNGLFGQYWPRNFDDGLNENCSLDGDFVKAIGQLSMAYVILYLVLLTKLWPLRKQVPKYRLWILQAMFWVLIGAIGVILYTMEYYHDKKFDHEYGAEMVNDRSGIFDVMILLIPISTLMMALVMAMLYERRSSHNFQQIFDSEQQAQDLHRNEEKDLCGSPSEKRYTPNIFLNEIGTCSSYGSIPREKQEDKFSSLIHSHFVTL